MSEHSSPSYAASKFRETAEWLNHLRGATASAKTLPAFADDAPALATQMKDLKSEVYAVIKKLDSLDLSPGHLEDLASRCNALADQLDS